MSHPLNPDNLPMRPPTPLESAYDVLAVRWRWWTDPVPRGPQGVTLQEVGAMRMFLEAARRLREHGIDVSTDGGLVNVGAAAALELAMALADGSER